MQHHFVGIDFETFYDTKNGYSLRKMDNPSYILDARFEATMCAVKFDNAPATWVDGPNLQKFFDTLDPAKTVMYGHNLMFDACIASWHFGFVPSLYICTLACARQLWQKDLRSISLDSLLKYHNLPNKGTFLSRVDGMRRADIINAGFWREYTNYAIGDIDGAHSLLKLALNELPVPELQIADMVLRMATVPKFKLNKELLYKYYNEEAERKQALLDEAIRAAGLTDVGQLMSNDQFAVVLQALGVDPPTKTSLTTGKETWAFAKSDQGMKDLLEHEDDAVVAVVEARLAHKSTQNITRARRYLNIAHLNFPRYGEGMFPVPLKVSGAHTHRLCLVGETIICILRDNRVVYDRLDKLRSTDLVWDGEEFVSHGGLAYAGRKPVISHDGITGTPDHRVWTGEEPATLVTLAAAKAAGAHISRGAVPDATRVNKTVFRRGVVPQADNIHLRYMQQPVPISVEGPAAKGSRRVQALRCEAAYAGADALQENVVSSGGEQQAARGRSAGIAGGVTSAGNGTLDARERALTDAASIEQVAPGGLGTSYGDCSARVPEVQQPQNYELCVLRRARHSRVVRIDSDNGRLAADDFGSAPGRDDARSHQPERALRAGQSSVGDLQRADVEPQLMDTWDIVDCGPRNRFMANGRLVHNSGDWKMNAQNPERNKPSLPPSEFFPQGRAASLSTLRRSWEAPPGHKVLACDSSQIEARLCASWCGQEDIVQQFRDKLDTYSIMATDIFGRPITKANIPERFVGKQCVLSAQFGVGPDKFRSNVIYVAREQAGLDMRGFLTPEFSEYVIKTYRTKTPHITARRRFLDECIRRMTYADCNFAIGPVIFRHEHIVGPTGLKLYYSKLRMNEQGEWIFTYKGNWSKLYGGKLLENIIQFLARCVVMEAALRLKPILWEMGQSKIDLQLHDELVTIVPDEYVDVAREHVEAEMRRQVVWMPNCPVDCESGVGPNYAEAK